jgi:hypothetical protein
MAFCAFFLFANFIARYPAIRADKSIKDEQISVTLGEESKATCCLNMGRFIPPEDSSGIMGRRRGDYNELRSRSDAILPDAGNIYQKTGF